MNNIQRRFFDRLKRDILRNYLELGLESVDQPIDLENVTAARSAVDRAIEKIERKFTKQENPA